MASHIVGGDIYYDYLGNNKYKIYISVFRDCHSDGADFDSPLPLGIFRASNNASVQQLEVPFISKTYVPITFNNPCVVPPTDICTENAIYTTIVTLPPIPGGYRVAYVRCCRGPSIINLQNPGDTGLTLTVNIPGIENNGYQNSSPRFNSYPPLLLCNNDDLIYDHSAIEPDGDQLVYSLATPFRGGSSGNPMPVPTPNPPYIPVSWVSGYSQIQPLGPGSSISINSTTGLLTASPNLTGKFVVGIKVDEYRNGVLISSKTRDFIFQVFNCNISMQAILPLETQLPSYVGHCKGNLNVQFINNSYGGTNYLWNFGDPTTTNDVSTAFQPTYNYPDTGKYIAMLVVNPGWPCTDTAYIEINLFDEINASITFNDSICLPDNLFQFNATSDGLPGTTYSWGFGNSATPATQNGQNASTHFNQSGQFPVILTSTYSTCKTKDTVVAHVLAQPIANFELPENYECDGLEVHFINNTENAINNFWTFGINGATSAEFEPTFTFPAGGTYTINYYASSTPLCVDSASTTIHVNEKLVVSFTQSPDQCITNNSFDFISTVSGPQNAIYYFTIDNGTPIYTTSITAYHFTSSGTHTITLTGKFDNCIESVTSSIFVFKEPTIGFGIKDGLQCEPYTAEFINYSSADTPLFFVWDFGDGSSSNLSNPTHVYTVAGNYPVTLIASTKEGCIDTLTLTQVDLINVKPKPTADFEVDKKSVHICNSVINFSNKSIGAIDFYYHFNDRFDYSTEENPSHKYYTSGDHYPYLIVTSLEGCKDTTQKHVYVEPFSVFIPNTFTPDADEKNSTFEAKMWVKPFEWELKIYNKWGEEVFVSYDPEASWDGTYNGKLVQDGLYICIVKYRPCTYEEEVIIHKGHVNVLR